MRKLKLQVQLSVDGYIAGVNGEMDWMTANWDDALKEFVTRLTDPVDLILLGRKLAEGFIPFWASNPALEGAAKMNNTFKIVFTNTIEKCEWNNTALAKGKLVDEVTSLKKEAGGDIIVYGGGSFVSSLIRSGMIDDFYLFINPAVLGKGMPIFNQVETTQNLTLVESRSFPCGITCLHYHK
ncbi:dihydrofolate reductase family protein [Longitalea arenae]|uniref:dihydrofolate reductase family protein n=1 Tax=Longitalea arenae TaxID=2812558 RepID=UPI001968240A|nr:dihydrofolate reductase family protein [Longitalea arenae]